MSAVARVGVALAVLIAAHPIAAFEPTEDRSIFTSVLDENGVSVTALSTEDFVVRENGVAREILDVRRASDPLQIAVLVDTSEAVRPHLNDLRMGLRSFITSVQGSHELAFFEFGERPALVADFSRDPVRQNAAVGQLFARSNTGSYLLDAIVDAARQLRKREGRRPVIVVITTEGPEFSDRYHQAVLDEVRKTGAALHSFIFDQPSPPLFDTGRWEREFTLSKGATETGGRREYLLTSMALGDRLRDLALELRNQYQIVYSRPESLIAPESVEISVRRAGLTARGAQAWTSEGWRVPQQ
jgi:Ca-activated chloride channel family protein